MSGRVDRSSSGASPRHEGRGLRAPGFLPVVGYVAAMLLACLAVVPALWLVSVALQPTDVGLDEIAPPTRWTTANFSGALADGGILRPLLNSVLVTIVQTALNVFLAALAAYPLARMRFRGRGVLFALILSTLMIPEQVVIVPMFRTVVGLGLYDSLLGVVIPFAVSAFGIYLCKQAFEAIPIELEEAAQIDGAGAIRTWWSVMLPLTAPTLATLAVFSVIGSWSALLWPLIVLQSREQFTLPVAINDLLGVFATNIRYAYAASVIALIPIVVAYLAMQRFLKGGVFAGAVKG